MPKVKSVDAWSGANNVFDPTALPPPARFSKAEALVEALNVDVTPAGTLRRRVGFGVIPTEDVITDTSFYKLGNRFVYVHFKGHWFIQDAFASEPQQIAGDQQINQGYPGAIVTAAEHNGELFALTSSGFTVRTDGKRVRAWGVPNLRIKSMTAADGTGGIPPGSYKVAITLVNAYGEEGAPYDVKLIESSTAFDLTIQPHSLRAVPSNDSSWNPYETPETVRVYMSADSGTTLYLQKEYLYAPQAFEDDGNGFTPVFPTTIRTITTTGMELVTQHLRPPPPGNILCSHHGVMLIANGKTLFYTTPLRVHQVDYRKGFFQFPAAITNVVSMDSGVYVTADKTYFLPKLETTDVSQHEVLNIPAVAGSAKRVSGDKAVWLTAYGMVIAEDGGNVKFLHRDTFVMPLMERAEVGIMQYNGLELAVVMPRGSQRPNRLAYDEPKKSATITPPV